MVDCLVVRVAMIVAVSVLVIDAALHHVLVALKLAVGLCEVEVRWVQGSWLELARELHLASDCCGWAQWVAFQPSGAGHELGGE